MLIFQCYAMDPPYGESVAATATTTPNKTTLSMCVCVCVCGHHFQETGPQPGMVANPDRGQVNRENVWSTVIRLRQATNEYAAHRISPLISRWLDERELPIKVNPRIVSQSKCQRTSDANDMQLKMQSSGPGIHAYGTCEGCRLLALFGRGLVSHKYATYSSTAVLLNSCKCRLSRSTLTTEIFVPLH